MLNLKGKRTYIGLFVAVLGAIAQAAGVEGEPGELDVVADGVVTFIGLLIAWIGRWRAKVDEQKKLDAIALSPNPAAAVARELGRSHPENVK